MFNVKAVAKKGGDAAGDQVPAGKLGWAPVHEFTNATISRSAAAVSGTNIYTVDKTGVRRWNTTDGRCHQFVAGDVPGTVLCLEAVGPDLWCCLAEGNIVVYDNNGEVKKKPFNAHNREILCIKASPPLPSLGRQFVVTGGWDFTLKTWDVDGKALGSRGHHHGAVECVLVTVSAAGKHKVWSGSADGTAFVWTDEAGDGDISKGDSRALKNPSGSGVCSLVAAAGGSVWAGTVDGRVLVWGAQDEELKQDKAVHSEKVSCLEAVGSHVWSGSADRTIMAHDAATFASLYTIGGDQGTFLKTILNVGWGVWTFNNKSIKVYTDEGILQASKQAADQAWGQLMEAHDVEAGLRSEIDLLNKKVTALEAELKQVSASAFKATSEAQQQAEKAEEVRKALAAELAAELQGVEAQLAAEQAAKQAGQEDLAAKLREVEQRAKAAEVSHAEQMAEKQQEADSKAAELAAQRRELEQTLEAQKAALEAKGQAESGLQQQLRDAQRGGAASQESSRLQQQLVEAGETAAAWEADKQALQARIAELEQNQQQVVSSKSAEAEQHQAAVAALQGKQQQAHEEMRRAHDQLLADHEALQDRADEAQKRAEDLAAQLHEAAERAAAAQAHMQAEVDQLAEQLAAARQDRYQLQVALKVAQKQSAARPDSSAPLRDLEAALTQACADYRDLLQEVERMRMVPPAPAQEHQQQDSGLQQQLLECQQALRASQQDARDMEAMVRELRTKCQELHQAVLNAEQCRIEPQSPRVNSPRSWQRNPTLVNAERPTSGHFLPAIPLPPRPEKVRHIPPNGFV
ncbi:hypothetical protein WJX72_008417 [[Myrmecia] bisecta]|uniref:Uncharacterized protein n=1 Tax=[Myrmecia] bisecta TaxID=41462 RepID=A0AAW1PHS8_9CHLO